MFSTIKNQDIILIRWWNRSSELHLQSQAPCNNLEKNYLKKKRNNNNSQSSKSSFQKKIRKQNNRF
jgi:hypothetical protein